MMDKAKLEYIWLDGYNPTQNMRSKTLVKKDFSGTLEECPLFAQKPRCQTNRAKPRRCGGGKYMLATEGRPLRAHQPPTWNLISQQWSTCGDAPLNPRPHTGQYHYRLSGIGKNLRRAQSAEAKTAKGAVGDISQ